MPAFFEICLNCPTDKWRTRCGLLAVGLCVALVALVPGGELEANSRDSDGSRMQARKVDFPSSAKDTLDPPDDRVDWRYFKLSDETRVSVEAKFTGSGGGAIRLTDASGDELASAESSGGEASLSKKGGPGVYYVSVEAASKTKYTLSLR